MRDINFILALLAAIQKSLTFIGKAIESVGITHREAKDAVAGALYAVKTVIGSVAQAVQNGNWQDVKNVMGALRDAIVQLMDALKAAENVEAEVQEIIKFAEKLIAELKQLESELCEALKDADHALNESKCKSENGDREM